MGISQANDFQTDGTVVDATSHSTGNDLNNNDVAAPAPKYTSYLEYIAALKKYSSGYKELHEIFTYTSLGPGTFRALLIDTMASGNVTNKLFAFEQLHELESTAESFARLTEINESIISELEKQTESALQARVIVIEIWDRRESGVRTVIDKIGLQYDIDPAFFLHFFIAGYDYRTSNHSTIRRPLPKAPRFLRFHGSMYHNLIQTSIPYFFNQRPSIYNSLEISSNMAAKQSYRGENIFWYSTDYQEWILSHERNAVVANDLDPLSYIVLWLEYKTYDLSISTRDLEYTMYKFENDRSSDDEWTERTAYGTSELEKAIYVFEDLFQSVREYSKIRSRPKSIPGLDAVISFYDRTVTDARTVLHLSTRRVQKRLTEMSIEESSRSVQEAISVKRPTQLALVFIPLSFVSSVFGMNLNELTGVGPHIWVFVTTAICLLATVLLFVPITNRLRENWKRRENKLFLYKREKMMFIYLCLKQRRLSLLRMGILLALLTNGRYGDFDATRALRQVVREQERRGVMMKYRISCHRASFRLFMLDLDLHQVDQGRTAAIGDLNIRNMDGWAFRRAADGFFGWRAR
ncbi:hypothetical protein BKA64DRAFT_764999 [Cadophora sp. MPI-SDFR-AT-0126]|nr:hypothetical protein BKA64DRAFT_764999 [Leotiomycetes sp. MPI-SDFR-AT-0126]